MSDIRRALLLIPLLAVAAATRADEVASDRPEAAAMRHFDRHVAPLLARHCLECHDTVAKEGGLDLSRKAAARAGGDSGPAIVVGNAGESLLWQRVESGEMPPEDRPRLSDDEKQRLRQWIEDGAVWSVESIDASAFLQPERQADDRIRRLTVDQYIETVRSAVGVDIEREARQMLPADLRADGFRNTAYSLQVDLKHVESYARLAEIIVARMDLAQLLDEHAPCRELSDACLREAVHGVGKWLLRGPLEDQETAALMSVARAVAEEGGDFDEAMRYVVEAMLQSPRFLYRIEKQRGGQARREVDGYELASRVSYAVWGGPPDKELMRAAEAGELADRALLEKQVRRMLDDPRAEQQSTLFVRDWLDLDRLGSLRPDPHKFPNWSAPLASDMREETLEFFREVAWRQRRPLAELLNAQLTFVTPRLAQHYGLPWDIAAARSATAPSDLDGLVALYEFDEGSGDVIRDRSEADAPLDLKIKDPAAVAWEPSGLAVHASTLLVHEHPPTRLIDAVTASQAITVEAWITPANTNQRGPARIVTLSSGSSQRNFTLGQDADRFEARFRTTRSNANGIPHLSSLGNSAEARPTHVALTRDADGHTRLYVEGQEQTSHQVGGDLSNWSREFQFALANETSGDRPWLGTLHRVAVYARALKPDEIRAFAQRQLKYDLTDVPGRGGLLTQGSVLTIGGDEASMVTRGLFILHDFLYSRVGNPPPGIDTAPVPSRPGRSQRSVAEERIADQSCGGCHARFEPLAFGLEKFDGMGAYHDQDEHGNPLRDDGEIHFPGAEHPISYGSSAELMDLLAGSERVAKGITRKVAQFVLGRPLVEADTPHLDRIHANAQENGGTYSSLVTAILTSDLVVATQSEEEP